MNEGDYFRHTARPDWGTGVVAAVHGDGKVDVIFENRGRVTLRVQDAIPMLERVDRAEIQNDSPLLERRRWPDIEPPPELRRRKVPRTSARCQVCNQPLSRSQYSRDHRWKSCPRCSHRDGHQHVFYEYPGAFGQSDARMTDETPDGAQSYCVACRAGEEDSKPKARTCTENQRS